MSTGLHVLAVLAAGALAIAITPHLQAKHRYWALVAAVVPLVGHSTRHRVARGLHRILGTAVGIGLLAVLLWVSPPVGVIVLLMGVAQFGAEMFINRNYFFAQAFVTPLALLGTSLGKDVTADLLYDRLVETVIGASVGMAAVLALAGIQRRLDRRPAPLR